jgi:chromosome segregation ATPase
LLFIKIIILISPYSLRYRSSLSTFALSLFLSKRFISDQLRAEKEKDKRYKEYKDNLSNSATKHKDSKYKEDHEEELNNCRNENDQLKSKLNNLNEMLDDIKKDQQEKPKNYYGEINYICGLLLPLLVNLVESEIL